MPEPQVTRPEPEMSISSLKDGTIVEVIPRSEFWTSVVIVIILLFSVPYLAYAVFKYYDLLSPHMNEIADKKTYEDMYIAAIVIVVLLSISSIIFISFYFKNYTKRAFSQDKISIKEAFQKISREIAQHAADEYSDEQVENHIEDMSTLGGRIMASKRGDVWYNDPKEFKEKYDLIPGEGYRRYTKKPEPLPPSNPFSNQFGEPPETVQGEISERAQSNENLGYQDATQEDKEESRNINTIDQKKYFWLSKGFTPDRALDLARANAPYVPW